MAAVPHAPSKGRPSGMRPSRAPPSPGRQATGDVAARAAAGAWPPGTSPRAPPDACAASAANPAPPTPSAHTDAHAARAPIARRAQSISEAARPVAATSSNASPSVGAARLSPPPAIGQAWDSAKKASAAAPAPRSAPHHQRGSDRQGRTAPTAQQAFEAASRPGAYSSDRPSPAGAAAAKSNTRSITRESTHAAPASEHARGTRYPRRPRV